MISLHWYSACFSWFFKYTQNILKNEKTKYILLSKYHVYLSHDDNKYLVYITISCSAVTNYFILLEKNNKFYNLPLCTACQVNAGQSLCGPNSGPDQNLGVVPWVSSIQGGGPRTPYGHGFILPFEPNQKMNQSGWVNEALLYLWGVLSQSTGLVIQVF